MNRRFRSISIASAFVALFVPSLIHATGLGNMTYTPLELEKPVTNFTAATFVVGPGGSNTVLMLRDVLIIMGSNDSGKPPGALHVFDVKDPRAPKLLKTLANTPETNQLRELHAMPVAMIDGKDILVLTTLTGIQFFDFTDPMNPKPVGALALPGVNGGDYDNAAWMLSWSWPYVYAGGTGNGVYIVDATDPAKATLVTRITSGELGNFRVGPVYAAGNYVVPIGMDQAPTHVSVIDVSDPKAPFLLTTGSTPTSLYSAVLIGDRIYGAGTNGDYSFLKWSPTAIGLVAQKKSGTDRGGYCTYLSGFVICGQSSEGYKKWDVRDEANIVQVGHGTDPNGIGGDFDFATVLGNLVYLGNDHGTGAALIPHTMAPDTTPPTVVKVYPNDQEVKQPLSTRVTIFFSEDIDLGTVNPQNIIVRKNGGAPVAGVFSRSSFNAISFGPRQPLAVNTTYEVVIPAGGLKDLVGNAIQPAATVRFSTGPSVDGALAGTGGAGGSSSPDGGGTGAGGAGPVGGTGGAGGTTVGGGAGGSVVSGPGPDAGASVTGNSGRAGCSCNLPGPSAPVSLLSLLGIAAWIGVRRGQGRRRRESITRE
jgi:hypothetical protein